MPCATESHHSILARTLARAETPVRETPRRARGARRRVQRKLETHS